MSGVTTNRHGAARTIPGDRPRQNKTQPEMKMNLYLAEGTRGTSVVWSYFGSIADWIRSAHEKFTFNSRSQPVE